MAGAIADAFVAVRANTKNFKPSLVGGIAGPLKEVAKLAAGAFAGFEAVDFFKDAIRDAASLEQAQHRVSTIFGESAEQVRKFAENAPTALGETTGAALSAAAALGQVYTSLGLSQGASAKLAEGTSQLAADLSSFTGKPVEEVFTALEKGQEGATRGLKSLGIVLDQAGIKQEALKLGLIKTTKDAITPAIKAQAIYGLEVARTTKAHGDFARRSGTLGNELKVLRAEWGNMTEEVGTRLLPTVTKVLGVFVRNLPAALDVAGAAFDAIGGAVSGLSGFLTPLGPIVQAAAYGFGKDGIAGAINAAAGALTQMVPAFEPIRSTIATTIGVLQRWKAAWDFGGLTGLLDAIGGRVAILAGDFTALDGPAKVLAISLTAVGVAMAFAFAPLTTIAIVVAAAAGAFVYFYKTNETFREGVQAVAAFLQGPGLAAFLNFASQVGAAVGQVADYFAKLGPDVLAAIHNVISVAVALWNTFGSDLISATKGYIEGTITVWRGVVTLIKGVIDVVVGLLSGDWGRAWDGVKEVVQGAVTIVSGILHAAGAVFGAALSAAGKVATAALAAAWAGLGALASAAIGAVAAGIRGAVGAVANAAEAVANAIVSAIKSAPGKIVGLAGDLVSAVTGAINQAAGQAYSEALTIGARIADGVVAGVGDLAGRLGSKIAGAAHSAMSSAAGALGIGSPSKVARDRIGIPIAQGITQGVADGMHPAPAAWSRAVVTAFDGFVAPTIPVIRAHSHGLGNALLLGFLEGTRDLPAKLKDAVKNAVTASAEAIRTRQQALSDAFGRVADHAMAAFDAATQAGLDKTKRRFDALRGQVDREFGAASNDLKLRFDVDTSNLDQQLKSALDNIGNAASSAIASVNSQLAATLGGLEGQRQQLTPAEAQLAQEKSAHDAATAAARLQAARDALLNAQASRDAKQIAQAQAALDEEVYQQHITALQAQAEQERQQRDVAFQQQEADAQTQAQAAIDRINADADAQRAAAQAQHDADAAARQSQYDNDLADLQAYHDAAVAELDDQEKREELNYQARRDVLRDALADRFDAIKAGLATEAGYWRSHQATILATINAATGGYRRSGQLMGQAFADGIRDSLGTLTGAAADLAEAIAKYLRLHSPAERGPLSTIDQWWTPLAPMLIKGVDTRAIDAALGGLYTPPTGAAITVGGRGGATDVSGLAARLDTLIELLRDRPPAQITAVVQAPDAKRLVDDLTLLAGTPV